MQIISPTTIMGYFPHCTLPYVWAVIQYKPEEPVTRSVLINTCWGLIDALDVHSEQIWLYTPKKYFRSRSHRLLGVPPSRTDARASLPVPRTLTALNKLVATIPECDLFADEWDVVLVCHKKYANIILLCLPVLFYYFCILFVLFSYLY